MRYQPGHSFTSVSSIPTRRHVSTKPFLCSAKRSIGARPTPPSTTPSVSRTQQQLYSSFEWTNPSRDARPSQEDDTNIQKPKISTYDEPFGSIPKATTGGYEDMNDGDYGVSQDIDLELNDIKAKDPAELPGKQRPTMRLVPRTGRTIHVGRNVDVARSFKLLAIQVNQNKLRQDFQYQRYHERPGLKRKRLRSERWQKRFKKGFKATVSRVKELTKQGW